MRKTGYYFVRGKNMIGGDWEIMFWDSEENKWLGIGRNKLFSDFFMAEINESRILNPNEK